MAVRLIAAVLLLLLAGCSETTLRRDSLSHVVIDGQEILVSWVEVPPDQVDLVVLGPVESDKPLDRETARAAAGRVAAGRCLLAPTNAVFPSVDYGDGQFAFRYVCGPSPSAPTKTEVDG